jgi:hypothetical protein
MDRPALRRGLTSLQRTAGKRAVGRLLARRGLLDLSGDPNDPLEYGDLESYLAGITVLSEEGARERWEELQRPVASAAARSTRTSSSSPGATTAMSLPDAQMLVGLHGRVGHVTAEHGQPQHRRVGVAIEDVAEDMASVTVRTVVYHEYLQVVQTHDGWKIANAL